MTTSTRPYRPLPREVLVSVDAVECFECFPDVVVTRLPGPVFEITATHSPECGLPVEVTYA